MPDTLNLFICYRSTDASKVDKIARNLALLKHADSTPRYAPWQDKLDILQAQDWWEAVVDAIEVCHVFVFHISRGSLESKACLAELKYAHDLNRPIIPVVLEDEFVLDPVRDRYELPEDVKALLPEWLRHTVLLFHTGANFYPQFDGAIEQWHGNWPQPMTAQRPPHPDKTDNMSNHARYDLAWQRAEALAFDEAREHFGVLVRSKDTLYGEDAAMWLNILTAYKELIDAQSHARTQSTFKSLRENYVARFSGFFEGHDVSLFDPGGFATMKLPTRKGMTAEEYVQQANEHQKNDRYDEAITACTEAIRLNSQSAEAYHVRGLSHSLKGAYDEAIADYTEAIRLNSQSAEVYIHRGHSHLFQGEYDKAIADYARALGLNPRSAVAYNDRGVVYHAQRTYDKAIADYDRALTIDPKSFVALANRQSALRAKQNQQR